MLGHKKKRGKGRMIFFLATIFLSLYLVNMSLGLVDLPDFFSKIDRWLILISGILLFFGGFNFLKVKRHNL
jgi:type IV secretory pathway TrbL component